MDYTILKWLEETRMCVDWTKLAQDPVNVTEPSYGYGMPFSSDEYFAFKERTAQW